MHETMSKFCNSIKLHNRPMTARTYQFALEQFQGWLDARSLDPLKATTDDIRAYQVWLSTEYRSPQRQLLEPSTQATRLAGVKSYYRWLEKRGLILSDVARKITLPKVRQSVTKKDYLTLQEVTALLQTQGGNVKRYLDGSWRWAKEMRTLALLCVAVATGRRRCSLVNIEVADLNVERNEVRIEREKGKSGRVLPITAWAMAIASQYVKQARPVLNWHTQPHDWLIVGDEQPQFPEATFARQLERVHEQTVEENPDLEELPAKHITPHGLRVSFATLLFRGGCNIRSVNELMDHENLSTTAKYTPIPLEDLRRVCRLAHPRA